MQPRAPRLKLTTQPSQHRKRTQPRSRRLKPTQPGRHPRHTAPRAPRLRLTKPKSLLLKCTQPRARLRNRTRPRTKLPALRLRPMLNRTRRRGRPLRTRPLTPRLTLNPNPPSRSPKRRKNPANAAIQPDCFSCKARNPSRAFSLLPLEGALEGSRLHPVHPPDPSCVAGTGIPPGGRQGK